MIRSVCARARVINLAAALALAAMALFTAPARANETDQFTLPLDTPFADLGGFFDALHYHILDEVVRDTNARIAEALKIKDPARRAARLEHLHSPQYLADAVRGHFKAGWFETLDLEDVLRTEPVTAAYPGQLTAYRTWNWIYTYTHLPVDPRRIILLAQSSTIKAYGVYFGTDKIAHFHDLGHFYFTDYFADRRHGMTEEDAVADVVETYSHGIISEGGIVGTFAAGVYSNGDLAANYMGFKFYRNLTEPVMLKGSLHPSLLVRKGEFWRLNYHVRPESGFFGAFVCDQWNEALNPCLYEWGVRQMVAWRLREMADNILAFYAGPDGKPRSPEYFTEKAHELSTYYGEDYGHSGQFEHLLTIGGECWPVYAQHLQQQTPQDPPLQPPHPSERVLGSD
jgi:hypothetical protein